MCFAILWFGKLDVMKLIISHQSAHAFWDYANPSRRGLLLSRVASVPLDNNIEKSIISAARSYNLDIPLHILVPSASNRHVSKLAHAHVWSKPFLYGDLYAVDDSLLVASPELIYYLMSKEMNIINAALLAMEMCGEYSTHLAADICYERSPLTTVCKLYKFFDRHFKGRLRMPASLALKWVADNSNSPMESALMLALCLSPRLGGYGIPVPLLNPVINYGSNISSMSQTSFSKGDLVWKEKRLIVEYNSDQEHTGGERISRDARRANALKYAGYHIIVVTKRQLQSMEDIDILAQQVAHILRKRLTPRTLQHKEAQRQLYKTLFPWWDYLDINRF